MGIQSPTPFLRLVAKAFIENEAEQLRDYCFIFPNRRSGVFFAKELADMSGNKAIILPEITSIAQFVADITGSIEISKIESLLLIYKEYCSIMGDRAETFDKFAYWGDTVLNDFNDTDKYLVDPKQLFRNIKDLKEIQANYLNKEQLEVIKKYFGETPVHQYSETDKLWKDSEQTKRFANLWDILYELYLRFNVATDNMGVSYSGKIYRSAVAKIREMSITDFKYKKYIFVGFNVLSTSEYYIFKLLEQKGIADFYWDYNSPTFKNRQNKATRFVGRNIKLFKSKINLNEKEIITYPHIQAIGIPSNIGQAKYTKLILDELIDNGDIVDTANATNTAIVLPEEFLLIPLLDSINPRITNVNITMGYPLRYTGIATLVACIARMHKNARKENEEFCYFHENIRELLTHPLLKMTAPEETSNLITYITQNNLFYVEQSIVNQCAPSLKYIFDPVIKTTDVSELYKYINRIITFAEDNLINNKLIPESSIEMGFIASYVDKLNTLASIVLKYDIPMNDNTFFYLVDRIISSATIAFEGEPLNGLQIMGILETRCLDFDNVIILSMNERIFPRKHYSRSFIPHLLRKANGMATVEFQECMYAYYFYRLISRAKNVTLLFDSRTQSISSGEPSRFIYQLQTLFPQSQIKLNHIGFNVYAPSETKIAIPKNERIMQILNRYRTDGSNQYLSASAINHYINCPLAFYFEKIEKLHIPDEMMEFMDPSTLGTIVHTVLQKIYQLHGKKNKNGIYVDENIINKILADELSIKSLIHSVINQIYLHKPDCNTPLTGETVIIGTAIFLLIKKLLSFDKEYRFTILQTELEEKLYWQIDDKLCVNIKQFIDRVDLIDINGKPYIRIIDYKTGKDRTSVSSVGMMFNAKSQNRAKAMLQLMLYCNIYKVLHHPTETIKPIIYSIRKISDSGFRVNKQEITDYEDINDEYMQSLRNVISEIFDSSVPFTQTQNEKNCQYCKFIDFCRK